MRRTKFLKSTRDIWPTMDGVICLSILLEGGVYTQAVAYTTYFELGEPVFDRVNDSW